jgi:hypothetical protein
VQKIVKETIAGLRFFPTESGLGFIDFLWKVMKRKQYPENPVNPV